MHLKAMYKQPTVSTHPLNLEPRPTAGYATPKQQIIRCNARPKLLSKSEHHLVMRFWALAQAVVLQLCGKLRVVKDLRTFPANHLLDKNVLATRFVHVVDEDGAATGTLNVDTAIV